MCRIFGFRSIINSQVHTSLVHAENALGTQSERHRDGWGVAYYISNAPHVIKSEKTAIDDRLFQKVSGLVSSQTVVAHIRKATQGNNNILNTHPFQYGPWIFVHNGHIKDFDKHREKLTELVDPELKTFILGDTDSEIIFYLILSEIKKRIGLDPNKMAIDQLVESCKQAVRNILKITGPCEFGDKEVQTDHNSITFVLTNGIHMAAHQGGQPLFYSTYKNKCSDRDSCPKFSQACENPSNDGVINHLIFSSEPLQGENIWIQMVGHQVVGVDENMKMYFCSL